MEAVAFFLAFICVISLSILVLLVIITMKAGKPKRYSGSSEISYKSPASQNLYKPSEEEYEQRRRFAARMAGYRESLEREQRREFDMKILREGGSFVDWYFRDPWKR